MESVKGDSGVNRVTRRWDFRGVPGDCDEILCEALFCVALAGVGLRWISCERSKKFGYIGISDRNRGDRMRRVGARFFVCGILSVGVKVVYF